MVVGEIANKHVEIKMWHEKPIDKKSHDYIAGSKVTIIVNGYFVKIKTPPTNQQKGYKNMGRMSNIYIYIQMCISWIDR